MQVFGESVQSLTSVSESQSRTSAGGGGGGAGAACGGACAEPAWGGARAAPAQERAIDALVVKLTDALRDGKVRNKQIFYDVHTTPKQSRACAVATR